MDTYITTYTLSFNNGNKRKILLVKAENRKEAVKQAEEHAYKNYPTAEWIRNVDANLCE